ncbi:hypothetical protein AB6D11_18680 [Vibrio splendidus]
MPLTPITPIMVHPLNLFTSVVTHQEGKDGAAFPVVDIRHHQFDEVEGYEISLFTDLPHECHFLKLPESGWVVYDDTDERLHQLICDPGLTFDEMMAGVNAMVDLCTKTFNIGRHWGDNERTKAIHKALNITQ